MTPREPGKRAHLVLVALAALVIAGCTTEQPKPTPATSGTATTVVVEREGRVDLVAQACQVATEPASVQVLRSMPAVGSTAEASEVLNRLHEVAPEDVAPSVEHLAEQVDQGSLDKTRAALEASSQELAAVRSWLASRCRVDLSEGSPGTIGTGSATTEGLTSFLRQDVGEGTAGKVQGIGLSPVDDGVEVVLSLDVSGGDSAQEGRTVCSAAARWALQFYETASVRIARAEDDEVLASKGPLDAVCSTVGG